MSLNNKLTLFLDLSLDPLRFPKNMTSFTESLRALWSRETSQDLPYHYVPSRAVAIVMLVIFGTATILHVAQALRYRLHWLIYTVCLCGLVQLVAWGFRLGSSYQPSQQALFQLQISLLILAPTPLISTITITLEYLMERLGAMGLRPKWYTISFVVLDSAAALTQAVGADMAAGASGNKRIEDIGTKVVVGGIAVQIITAVLLCAIVLGYARYGTIIKPGLLLHGMALSLVFLAIRGVSRIIAFSQGWHGKLLANQSYFCLMDATMIILAMFTLLAVHPGQHLPKARLIPCFVQTNHPREAVHNLTQPPQYSPTSETDVKRAGKVALTTVDV
ncbi:hypothetical protein CPC08DRAFT_762590 [Agrocybe pediades]|nr:hypothetical protein CPC08DRAFT_762590 [Agrocybe pediades]